MCLNDICVTYVLINDPNKVLRVVLIATYDIFPIYLDHHFTSLLYPYNVAYPCCAFDPAFNNEL